MQHRPVLGGVDVPSGEHGIAAFGDPCPAGHGEQGVQGRGVHPVLRVVEDQVPGTGHHPRAAIGVLGEELAQVPTPDPGRVLLQGAPLRCRREIHRCAGLVHGSSILSQRRSIPARPGFPCPTRL